MGHTLVTGHLQSQSERSKQPPKHGAGWATVWAWEGVGGNLRTKSIPTTTGEREREREGERERDTHTHTETEREWVRERVGERE